MKSFAAAASAGVTVGAVSWNVTYDAPDDFTDDVFVELYDSNGNVQYSAKVPCKPPFGCPVAMENVALGSYTAGLTVGDARYYFDSDLDIITSPNDSAHATIIVVSIDALNQEIVLHVRP
jgi:hypothetical protein